MKKYIAALLCFVMFFTLVSCSSQSETVPEYETGMSDEIVDLKGTKIIVGMAKADVSEDGHPTLTYIDNTELGDLAIQRVKDVQNKFNCTIQISTADIPGDVAYTNTLGGLYVYDYLIEYSYWLVNYLKSGVFVDLTGIDNLDVFDETKWGSRYMRVSTMYDGAIYGVLPALHPLRLQNSPSNIVAINEKYITDLTATDPRDYFENGEWNWDTFDNCLKTFAHTGVTSNEFVYSLATRHQRFYLGLAACNGFTAMKFNDDGSFEYGATSENAIKAYHQVYDWLFGETAMNILDSGSIEGALDDFLDEKAVMSIIDTYMVLGKEKSVAYRVDSFGIVPLPCGPDASGPNNYIYDYECADFTMCIPVTAPDPEVSAMIMNAIYEPFPGFETKEQITEYLIRNYFNDERDAKVFMDIAEDDHVYYHDHYHGFSEMYGQFDNGGVEKTVQSFSSRYTKNAEKFLLPSYKTLEQYEEYFHQ